MALEAIGEAEVGAIKEAAQLSDEGIREEEVMEVIVEVEVRASQWGIR